MLAQTNKKGFETIFLKKISLKHMVTEMSGWGNVLVEKCPFGKLSVGELSVGDLSSGKYSHWNVQSGKCPYTFVIMSSCSNLLHIFFDSYSANTKNINVTTLGINVIILFTRQVQEKLIEKLRVDQLCFLCHISPLHFI